MFIAATSNGATNMLAMEVVSKGAAGIAFICHQSFWTQALMTCVSTNGTRLHQSFGQVDVAFLTRRQQKRDQPACSFTPQVDFGAETATAAT
jgi:hypothetical protein